MHANSSTLSRKVKRLFFNMYRDGIIIEVKIEGFLENRDYLQIIWYSDWCVWTWRMPGERYLPEFVVSMVNFGFARVMVWGCFSWFGIGPLVLVNANTRCWYVR